MGIPEARSRRLPGKLPGFRISRRWYVQVLLAVLLASVIGGGQGDLEGTLLFLHVWKCGGTSLRQLLCDWAKREGLACATVASCRKLSLQVGRARALDGVELPSCRYRRLP